MLKFEDLKDLSVEEIESKSKILSRELIPKLVEKGILSYTKTIKFESNNMYNLDLSYTVTDNCLYTECEGNVTKEYIIAITNVGFKTLCLLDGEVYCGDIKICSIESDKVIYNGEFDSLEYIDDVYV